MVGGECGGEDEDVRGGMRGGDGRRLWSGGCGGLSGLVVNGLTWFLRGLCALFCWRNIWRASTLLVSYLEHVA